MKRSPLAFAALVLGLVACQDMATAPELSSVDLAVLIDRSNPPPPPIDTGASISVSLEVATTRLVDPFSLRTSVVTTDLSGQAPAKTISHSTSTFVIPITIPVTYTRNEEGTGGSLTFHPDLVNHVFVDPHASVHQDAHGNFVGTGNVTITTIYGQFVMQLPTVIDSASVFEGCGESEVANHPELCFGTKIGTSTLNGDFLGQAMVTPACYPNTENHFCFPTQTSTSNPSASTHGRKRSK
jgi:hypothetical protein